MEDYVMTGLLRLKDKRNTKWRRKKRYEYNGNVFKTKVLNKRFFFFSKITNALNRPVRSRSATKMSMFPYSTFGMYGNKKINNTPHRVALNNFVWCSLFGSVLFMSVLNVQRSRTAIHNFFTFMSPLFMRIQHYVALEPFFFFLKEKLQVNCNSLILLKKYCMQKNNKRFI